MGADGFFQVRRLGSDGQFALTGELDIAVTDRLLEAVQPVIDEGHNVTLDLSGLTFLDSSGVHAFIEVGQRAAHRGAALVLRSPSRPALRVLEIVSADRFAGIRIMQRESA
jgi:anti-sigma B factor antagonist